MLIRTVCSKFFQTHDFQSVSVSPSLEFQNVSTHCVQSTFPWEFHSATPSV